MTAMGGNCEALAAEIHRVVTNPYPTQLKTLHDILARSSSSDVELWAACHPCQVFSLASAVTEALPKWSYALHIVSRLSSAVEVRDALLRAEPLLLDRLASKASDAQGRKSRYTDAAIAVLQHALPEDVALPAAAQSLLLRLFEQAASSPGAVTIRPVYALLRGACGSLLGLLPGAHLAEFEKHVFAILRNFSGVEDQSLGLYCLSIMKILLHATDDIPCGTISSTWADTQPSPSRVGATWTPNAIEAFFTGTKAQKTLQLVVLRVIYACKPSTAELETVAVTSVRLASDILEAVPSHIRAVWCARNLAIVRKLHDKSIAQDLTPDLRLGVLTFVGALSETSKLPQQAVNSYKALLLQPTGIGMFYNSLRYFAPRLDEGFWLDLLNMVLDVLQLPISHATLHLYQSGAAILSSACGLVDDIETIRRGILSALTSNRTVEMVRTAFSSGLKVETFTNDTYPDACTSALEQEHGKVVTALCSLALRCALAARHDEPQLPSELAPVLVHTQASRHAVAVRCTHNSHNRANSFKTSLDFVEAAQTPQDHLTGEATSWKARIKHLLQAQGERQTDSVLSVFSAICQELEERCENVEAPLQYEKLRYAELESRYTAIERAYGEIEGHIMDRDLRIGSLELENERSAKDRGHGSEENQRLLQQVSEAEMRLKQANDTARADLDTSRNAREHADIEHAAVMAQKQDELDAALDQLDHLRRDLHSAEQALDNASQASRQATELNQSLYRDLEAMQAQIHSYRTQVDGYEQDRKLAVVRQDEFLRELEACQGQLAAARINCNDAKSEVEEFRVSSRQALDGAAASYEESLFQAKQNWENAKAGFEQEVDSLNGTLIEATDAHKAQMERRDDKISELRKRAERLHKECSRKDMQIIEAQEMRNKLMSAMGLGGAPSAQAPKSPRPLSSLPFRSASTTSTPYSQAPTTPGGPAADAEESIGSVDSAASSQHGPTPKRARPRKAFKVPSMQPARPSHGMRSTKSAARAPGPISSAMKRLPLTDLGPNQSPRKYGRSPSKVMFKDLGDRREHVATGTADRNALNDWDFTEDLLTGTPGAALGRVQSFDGLDEESTADV